MAVAETTMLERRDATAMERTSMVTDNYDECISWIGRPTARSASGSGRREFCSSCGVVHEHEMWCHGRAPLPVSADLPELRVVRRN